MNVIAGAFNHRLLATGWMEAGGGTFTFLPELPKPRGRVAKLMAIINTENRMLSKVGMIDY